MRLKNKFISYKKYLNQLNLYKFCGFMGSTHRSDIPMNRQV